MKTPEDFQNKYTDRDIDIANRRDIRSDALFVFSAMRESIAQADSRIHELERALEEERSYIGQCEFCEAGLHDDTLLLTHWETCPKHPAPKRIAELEAELAKHKPKFEIGDTVIWQKRKVWITNIRRVYDIRYNDKGGDYLPTDAASSEEYLSLPEPPELTAEQKLVAMANELRKCTFDHIPQLDAIIDKYVPIKYGKVKGAE